MEPESPRTEIDRREPALPDLRRLTQARVQLGRFGAGIPTRAAQAFSLDHARARQGVLSDLDRDALRRELAALPLEVIDVDSMAGDRSTYVRRPDLGRQLSAEATRRLESKSRGFDVGIIVGDGLSASAVAINAAPLVLLLHERFAARGLSLAPIVVAAQARVALADPIGERLRMRVAIMLIGERPGLSAADSLGVYITYAPVVGTPDSRRNCISNIRDGGLSIEKAADEVLALVMDMLNTGVSGIGLTAALAKLGSD